MALTAYEHHKRWVAKYPEKRRAQKRRWYMKNAKRISEEYKARSAEIIEERREYYKQHPVKLVARHLKHKYGMTIDDFEKMSKEQDDCCAICGLHGSESRDGRLHVDHCHDTDKIRGLLCNLCNVMLGLAKDNPSTLASAASYLLARGGRNSQD